MLTFSASAQIITDSIAATAARDSLLRIANNARRFAVSAPRTAMCRHVVRGYYTMPNGTASRGQKAWEQVTKTYLSGATNERYTGYTENGLIVLRERRHNGSITWLKLLPYQVVNGQNAARPGGSTSGDYTREGYVRWGPKLYLVPRLTAER
ncbi:hypothetical protein [Hymenobacter roseosalivarius]|uniref:hypothetical protein n=1 Tax=Hymenobacter roseosalivarius TaxID=89967 RepID=UPI00117B248C|nr:hypothetical protein [Hymenobacter roseosalivarius]